MKELKPVKAQEQINKKPTSAVFTDRDAYKKVFIDAYNSINNNTMTLYFYATGGYGKSSLLEYLIADPYIKDSYKVMYDTLEGCSKIDILAAIWKSIKLQSNNKFIFPFFEPLYYLYEKITNKNYSKVDNNDETSKNIITNSISQVFESLKNVKLNDFNIFGLVNQLLTYTNDAGKIIKAFSKEYKKRKYYSDNVDLYIKFEECVNKSSIIENIHIFFINDLKYNIQKYIKDMKPIVIFIDTLEHMISQEYLHNISIRNIDENILKNLSTIKNNWLIGENGLIRGIDGVLWVLAGRNSLFDINDNNVYSKELVVFNNEDSRTYLEKNDIFDPDIQDSIINLCSGTPVYLSMCVTVYLKNKLYNKAIDPSTFKLMDLNELSELYCRCLNEKELRIIRILSLMKSFRKDDFKIFFEAVRPNDNYLEHQNDFYNIINSTNIDYNQDNQVYIINDVVASGILKDVNFSYELKIDYINKLLDAYFFDPAGLYDEEEHEPNYKKIKDYSMVTRNILSNVIDDQKFFNNFIDKVSFELLMHKFSITFIESFPEYILAYFNDMDSNIKQLFVYAYYYCELFKFSDYFDENLYKEKISEIYSIINNYNVSDENYKYIIEIYELLIGNIINNYNNFYHSISNNLKDTNDYSIDFKMSISNEEYEILNDLLCKCFNLIKKYKYYGTYYDEVLKFKILLTINNNTDNDLMDDVREYSNYICNHSIFFSGNSAMNIYYSGDSTMLALLLYHYKKYEAACIMFEMFFKDGYFLNNSPEYIFKIDNFDLKYFRCLLKTGNYELLNRKSLEIYNCMKDYIQNSENEIGFNNFDLFKRHTYYTRSLYRLSRYDEALKESIVDSNECVLYFNKDDIGYIYNKMFPIICRFRLGDNECFELFKPFENSYDKVFDRIDPEIKEIFMQRYKDYISKNS